MKGTFSTNALGIFYTLGLLLYQEIRKMLWVWTNVCNFAACSSKCRLPL